MFGALYFGQTYFSGFPVVITTPVVPTTTCAIPGFGTLYFGQYPVCGGTPTPPVGGCPYPGFGVLYFGQYPVCGGGFVPPIVPPVQPPLTGFQRDGRGRHGKLVSRVDLRRLQVEEEAYEEAEEEEIIKILARWLGKL